MVINFLVSVILLLFVSCRQAELKMQWEWVNYNIKDSISFSYKGINPINVKVFNDSIFVTYYPEYNVIHIYSSQLRKQIDSIYLKDFHIINFCYINNDSIWIYGDNYTSKKRLTLFLLDRNENIKKSVNFMSIFRNSTYISTLFHYDENNFDGKVFFQKK